MQKLKRDVFIDHLRGFIFAYMAFDHVIHAYAQNWGRFWFIKDFDRQSVWDMVYLFDQSIIMPMLFLLVGLNVLPSLKRWGIKDYAQRRFVKLGLPFLFCIPFIVPLLSFPRYQLTVDPSIDFYTFWTEVFFSQKLQAGPLWVCYGLFLYSFILIALNQIFPNFISGLGRWMSRLVQEKPYGAFIGIFLLSAVILGLSDLLWGAPWWIGFWKVFYLQGGRFLLYFLYFLLGAGLQASGLLENTEFMKNFSQKWLLWLGLMILAGLGYTGYATLYFDQGAYSDAFRLEMNAFFDQGGAWHDFGSFLSVTGFDILIREAPGVLIRTTLHGLLCLCQSLFLFSVFYKFLNVQTPVWQSLARSCYGIFLTHEAMVIWLQYSFIGVDLPIIYKIVVIFVLGFGGSWLLSDKVLVRLNFLKPVLT